MSNYKSSRVGGCGFCHYKIMGGLSDVSSYTDSDSRESKQELINILYEFVKSVNRDSNHNPKTDLDKVKYIHANLNKISKNGDQCKVLGALINAKMPGKIDLSQNDAKICSSILEVFSQFNSNMVTEHKTIADAYEKQILHLQNVIDTARNFMSELEDKVRTGDCAFGDKVKLESNLQNIKNLEDYASSLLSQVNNNYDSDFARYNKKVNESINNKDYNKVIEMIRNNKDDDLNKNLVNMIRVVKPLAIITYYIDKALEHAEVDAKKFYSLNSKRELSDLLNESFMKNLKIINTPKGASFMRAIEILQTAYPHLRALKNTNPELFGSPISGGAPSSLDYQNLDNLFMSLDASDKSISIETTQRKLERLRDHIKSGRNMQESGGVFRYGTIKIIRDNIINLITESYKFAKKIAMQGTVLDMKANKKFTDSIIRLVNEVNGQDTYIFDIFTRNSSGNRDIVYADNIKSSIRNAQQDLKQLNVPELSKDLENVLNSFSIIVNEILPAIGTNSYPIYGGEALEERGVILGENIQDFSSNMNYYTNVNVIRASLKESETVLSQYNKQQLELNKNILSNMMKTVGDNIIKIREELLNNNSLSESDLSTLDMYLSDLRESVINMYRSAETIDFILRNFHKKILMGQINNNFDNLLRLIQNVTSVNEWKINEKISSINNMFLNSGNDVLTSSPYLKNMLQSLDTTYDIPRMSATISYYLYKESLTKFGESDGIESLNVYAELMKTIYLIATRKIVNVDYEGLMDKIMNIDYDMSGDTYSKTTVRDYVAKVLNNFRGYASTNILGFAQTNNFEVAPQNITGGDERSELLVFQFLLDVITMRIEHAGGGIDRIANNRNANNYNVKDILTRVEELKVFTDAYLGDANNFKKVDKIEYSSKTSELFRTLKKLSVLRNMFRLFAYIGENIDSADADHFEIGTIHTIMYNYVVATTFIPIVAGDNLDFDVRSYKSGLDVNSQVIVGGASKYGEEIEDIKLNAKYITNLLMSALYNSQDALLAADVKGRGARNTEPFDNANKIISFIKLLSLGSMSNNEVRFIFYGLMELYQHKKLSIDEIANVISGNAKNNADYVLFKNTLVKHGAKNDDNYIRSIVRKHADTIKLFISDPEIIAQQFKTNEELIAYDGDKVFKSDQVHDTVEISKITSTKYIMDVLLKCDFSGNKYKEFISALWKDQNLYEHLINQNSHGLALIDNAVNPNLLTIKVPENDDTEEFKNPKLLIAGAPYVAGDARLGGRGGIPQLVNPDDPSVGGIFDQMLIRKINVDHNDFKSGNVPRIVYDSTLDLFEYEDENNIVLLGGADSILGGTVNIMYYDKADDAANKYKTNYIIIAKNGNEYFWHTDTQLNAADDNDKIILDSLNNTSIFELNNIGIDANKKLQYSENNSNILSVLYNNMKKTKDNNKDYNNKVNMYNFIMNHTKNKKFKSVNNKELLKYFYSTLQLSGILNSVSNPKVQLDKVRYIIDYEKTYAGGGARLAAGNLIDNQLLPTHAKNKIKYYCPTSEFGANKDLAVADIPAAATHKLGQIKKNLLEFRYYAAIHGGAGVAANNELPHKASLSYMVAHYYNSIYFTNCILGKKKTRPAGTHGKSAVVSNVKRLFKLCDIVDGKLDGNEHDFDIEANQEDFVFANTKVIYAADHYRHAIINHILDKDTTALPAYNNINVHDHASMYLDDETHKDEVLSNTILKTNLTYDKYNLSMDADARKVHQLTNNMFDIDMNDGLRGNIATIINKSSANVHKHLYNDILKLRLYFEKANAIYDLNDGHGKALVIANYENILGAYTTLRNAAGGNIQALTTDITADKQKFTIMDLLCIYGIHLNNTIYIKNSAGNGFAKFTPLNIGGGGTNYYAPMSLYNYNRPAPSDFILEGGNANYNSTIKKFLSLFMFGCNIPTKNNNLYMGNRDADKCGIFNIFNNNVIFEKNTRILTGNNFDQLYSNKTSSKLSHIIYSLFLLRNGDDDKLFNYNTNIYGNIINNYSTLTQSLYSYIVEKLYHTLQNIFNDNDNGALSISTIPYNVHNIGVYRAYDRYACTEALYTNKSVGATLNGIDAYLFVKNFNSLFDLTYNDLIKGNAYFGGAGSHNMKLLFNCAKNICNSIIDSCRDVYLHQFLDMNQPAMGLIQYTAIPGGNDTPTDMVLFEDFRIKDNKRIYLSNDKSFNILSLHNYSDNLLTIINNLANKGLSEYSDYTDKYDESRTKAEVDPNNNNSHKNLAFPFNDKSNVFDEKLNENNGALYLNHLVTINEILDNLRTWFAIFRHEGTLNNFKRLYRVTIFDNLKNSEIITSERYCLLNKIVTSLLSDNGRHETDNLLNAAPSVANSTYIDLESCNGDYFDKMVYSSDDLVDYKEILEDTDVDTFLRAKFLKEILLYVKSKTASKITKDFIDGILVKVNKIDITNEYEVRKFLIYMGVVFYDYDRMYYEELHKSYDNFKVLFTNTDFRNSMKIIHNYILKAGDGDYRDSVAKFVGKKFTELFKWFDVDHADCKSENIRTDGTFDANFYRDGISDIHNLNTNLKGILGSLKVVSSKIVSTPMEAPKPYVEWVSPINNIKQIESNIVSSLIQFANNNIDEKQLLQSSNNTNLSTPVVNITGTNANIDNIMNKSTEFKQLYKHIYIILTSDNQGAKKYDRSTFVNVMNNLGNKYPRDVLLLCNFMRYIINALPNEIIFNLKDLTDYVKSNKNLKANVDRILHNFIKNNVYGGAVENLTMDILNDKHKALLLDKSIDINFKHELANSVILPDPSSEFDNSNGFMDRYKDNIYEKFLQTNITIEKLLPENADDYATLRTVGGAAILGDYEDLNPDYFRRRIDNNAGGLNHNWAAMCGANKNTVPWLVNNVKNGTNVSIIGMLLHISHTNGAHGGGAANIDVLGISKLTNILNFLNLEVLNNDASGNPIEVRSKCKNLREFINMYPIPKISNIHQLKAAIEGNGYQYVAMANGEEDFTAVAPSETFKIINNVSKYMNAKFYNTLSFLLKYDAASGLNNIGINQVGGIAVEEYTYYKNIIENCNNPHSLLYNNYIRNFIICALAEINAGGIGGGLGGAEVNYNHGKDEYKKLTKITDNNKLKSELLKIFDDGIVNINNISTFSRNGFVDAYSTTPLPLNNSEYAYFDTPGKLSTLYVVTKFTSNKERNYELYFKDRIIPTGTTVKNYIIKNINTYKKYLSDLYNPKYANNKAHKDEISEFNSRLNSAIRNWVKQLPDNITVFNAIDELGKLLTYAPIKQAKSDKEYVRQFIYNTLSLGNIPNILNNYNKNVNNLLYNYNLYNQKIIKSEEVKTNMMKPFSLKKVLELVNTYPTAGNVESKIDADYYRLVLLLQISRTAYLLANSPGTVNDKYVNNFTKVFDDALKKTYTSHDLLSLHTYGVNYTEQAAGVNYEILAANTKLELQHILRMGIGSLTYRMVDNNHKFYKESKVSADDLLNLPGAFNNNNSGLAIPANQVPDGAGGLINADASRFLNSVAINYAGGNPYNAVTVEPSLKQLLLAVASVTNSNAIVGGVLPSAAAANSITQEDVKNIVELYQLSKNINKKNLNTFVKKYITFATKFMGVVLNKNELLASLLARHVRGDNSSAKHHIYDLKSNLYDSSTVANIYKSGLEDFTSSHTLNEIYYNTDNLFVNVIKSINARIFEALGLYDLYNHRGIYKGDSGKFLTHKTRMLIGAGTDNTDIDPAVADLYIRLPLLGLFYKSLFEKSGVSSYKFGIVPDNSGIFGPFIEYIFIRLEDNVKYVSDLTNDEVYNIVILCNNILNSSKTKDTQSIYSSFIGEVNKRYGYINSRMYDDVKDSIKKLNKIQDYPDLKRGTQRYEMGEYVAKLPGEDKVPVYYGKNYNAKYDMFNFNEPEKLNLDSIKNTIYEFRKLLDNRLTNNIQSNSFLLEPYIEKFRANIISGRTDKINELKEFYRLIDNYTEKNISPVNILFTEFVRSGVELLEYTLQFIYNLYINSLSMDNNSSVDFDKTIIPSGPLSLIYINIVKNLLNVINNDAIATVADYTTAYTNITNSFNNKYGYINSVAQFINDVTQHLVNYGNNFGNTDLVIPQLKQELNNKLLVTDDIPLLLYGNSFIPYERSSNIRLDFRLLKNKVKDLLDMIILFKSKFYRNVDNKYLSFYDSKLSKLIDVFNKVFNYDSDSYVNKINENLGKFELSSYLNAGNFLIHNSLKNSKLKNIGNSNYDSKLIVKNLSEMTMLTPIQLYNTILYSIINNFSDLNKDYYYKGIIDAIRSKEINEALLSEHNSTIDDNLESPNDIYVNKSIISRYIVIKLKSIINPDELLNNRDRPNPENFKFILDNLTTISDAVKNKMSALIPAYNNLLGILVNNCLKMNDLINAGYTTLNANKRELADIILVVNNKIINASRHTIDNLTVVYKDLGGQVNTYMEPYNGFNEVYEQRHHQPHLAPLSFMLYSNGFTVKKTTDGAYYESSDDSIDNIFPINTSIKNSKFINALKIIYGDSIVNVGTFTWIQSIVDKYNSEGDLDKFSNEEINNYIKLFTDLSKNNLQLITNSVLQGRNNMILTTEVDNKAASGAKYIERVKSSLSIEQMVNVLENDDISGYERLKELFKYETYNNPQNMNDKSQSIISNLIEINIPPINLSEMMKEIPFSTMFNSIYNFDKFIERNVDYVLAENRQYPDRFIEELKLYLKNPILFDKNSAVQFNDMNIGVLESRLYVDNDPTYSLSILLNYIHNVYKITLLSIKTKMGERIGEKYRSLKGAEIAY